MLQEEKKSWGPRVKPLVEQVERECGIVIVRSSKSGKMDNNLVRECVDHFKEDFPGSKLLWDKMQALTS